MAHLAAVLFFLGLLVALGVILELTVRTHWSVIVTALGYGRTVSAPAQPRRHHAAS